MRVEILLEEPSMEEVLKNILPKILPEGYKLDENVFLRPHNGKSDLRKSIPNKVRAFSKYYEPVKIIILHDQDNVLDCKNLKNSILELCKDEKNNFYLPCLVRIVCQELESWYIGDLEAIEKAYTSFRSEKYKNKKEFRNPDIIEKPSQTMKHILPNFQKIQTAKDVSKYMDINNNKSESFCFFISGIQKFLNSNS